MIITLDNLTKKFGKNILFQNLNYKFELDKVYGIQGHNGSGKSTLLKLILGLESPNTGSIHYSSNNEDIKRENVYKYISIQAPYIDFPTNITLGDFFKFHFSQRAMYKDSLDELIAKSTLPVDRELSEFSSGMMQKTKLITAFLSDSKVVLLDEPTEMLDESSKLFFKELITNYSSGRIVIVSSNKKEDFVYCDETLDIISYK